jgi:hypothetical protein
MFVEPAEYWAGTFHKGKPYWNALARRIAFDDALPLKLRHAAAIALQHRALLTEEAAEAHS